MNLLLFLYMILAPVPVLALHPVPITSSYFNYLNGKTSLWIVYDETNQYYIMVPFQFCLKYQNKYLAFL